VPICPQQRISVLRSFLQAASLNFSPRLIEFIGQLGPPMSQSFLNQHFGNQALEPHNEAAVFHIHTHPTTPSTDLTILPKKLAFSGNDTSV
jgi:hypothetical protein